MKFIVCAALCLIAASCATPKAKSRPTPTGLPAGVVPLFEQQLPVDRQVTVGQLDNGMRYYIRRNREPETRAELRLVVDVGSVMERDDQRGLAHFAEHMAFNGTARFAKQELVAYLETIGMRFGPDINAYTSFDETVYMLQVPTDNPEVVEKAIEILVDWAHGVSFEPEEIDKERGVVIDEWRRGRGAGARLRDRQLPVVLHGSRYAERLPIGKKSVLDTFDHRALTDFYRAWYRPDLMAVVAVGDFEPQWMEQQLRAHFSELASPVSASARPEFAVPDHEETLFAIAADPEATHSSITVYHKQDVQPEGRVGDYYRYLVQALYHRMLNQRLEELTVQADPPYLQASSTQVRMVRSKDAYMLRAVVADNGIERGLEAILQEAQRVLQHGFTAGELDREKKAMLRRMEQSFRERDKTHSGRFADEYKRSYLNDEPIPGLEFEYGFYKSFVPKITLQQVNELADGWLRPDNRVIAVSVPEKAGIELPQEEGLLALFASVAEREFEPYVEELSDAPLLAEIPAETAIVAREVLPELGLTRWRLENGVVVLLKPTDFKNDEVLFSGSSPGGFSLADDEHYIAARTADGVVRGGGVGEFDHIALEKRLAGKVVSVQPWISGLQEGLRGSASPEDLETMFQLVHLYGTAPRADTTAFAAYQGWMRGVLENRGASPEAAFADTLQLVLAQHHFRARPWSEALIGEMDLETSLQIYRERFGDFGDFAFIFVGSFDLETMEPLVRRYLGGLPHGGRQESWRDVGIEPPQGVVERYVYKGVEAKSQTQMVFHGPFDWDYQNFFTINAVADVLQIKLREVMREDLSGTYSVGVKASATHYPKESYSLSISFSCDPSRAEELSGVVMAQIEALQETGLDIDYVQKIQEMRRRRHEVRLRQNGYWLGLLDMAHFHGINPTLALDYFDYVDALDVEVVQQAARRYFNRDNYVRVVLLPENYIE